MQPRAQPWRSRLGSAACDGANGLLVKLFDRFADACAAAGDNGRQLGRSAYGRCTSEADVDAPRRLGCCGWGGDIRAYILHAPGIDISSPELASGIVDYNTNAMLLGDRKSLTSAN